MYLRFANLADVSLDIVHSPLLAMQRFTIGPVLPRPQWFRLSFT